MKTGSAQLSLSRFLTREHHRIHLIGVAGSGMSGIAALLLELGHQVSGSDKSISLEVERLQRLGLQFFPQHRAQDAVEAELIVYSSAIKSDNPILVSARQLETRAARRAEALAAIMQGKRGIIIGGMHGKTTTSAMAAHVLREGGLHPSHYVGAEIPILGQNAHWDPRGEFFVAEGDESDGTIRCFHPEHILVLNIEPEHLDFYEDLTEIEGVFHQLIGQTSGKVFFCADDAVATRVCQSDRSVSYGFGESVDYRAQDVSLQDFASIFSVFRQGQKLGEIKYASDRFLLVDDYAHHPTEIRATLAAARSTGRNRVLTMFQPHRYTRTKALRQEFGAAFDQADRVVITDVYPASEPPIPGISGRTIADAISAHGHRGVTYQSRFAHVHHDVGNMLASGDLVLSLGAGNIHEQLSILAAGLVVAEKLKGIVGEEGEVRLHEPMAKHTTLRVGGPAQFWIEPRTEKAFAELIRFCRRENHPLFVIGRGSNLLVRDGGITGVVAHPCGGEFDDIAVNGNEITAGVGAKLKQVAYAGRDAGIGGLEWMEGIPGEVGGALRMNAGAMGGQTFEHVVSVRVLDPEGNAKTMTPSEMEVYYRHVPTLEKNYAVSAIFRGVPGGKDEIVRKLEESQHKRKTTQPAASSAGCIFKNPGNIPAGKLVDELGLKNCAIGKARVSEVHGNFIVNDGGATAAEMLKLIAKIQATAREKRGVELQTEVQIVGEEE
ncbi:MAG: UDP-N-acetylenolpyruvoylglucosamine reductase [Verrucomicrobia bacterium 13_1_20CM_4_54_11]|nr:MAG: UDP-N-acetylenolpyruvoylglucosamine reductase [Verrucomicrobia bacterium 13_1_20CM_4_54_11]